MWGLWRSATERRGFEKRSRGLSGLPKPSPKLIVELLGLPNGDPQLVDEPFALGYDLGGSLKEIIMHDKNSDLNRVPQNKETNKAAHVASVAVLRVITTRACSLFARRRSSCPSSQMPSFLMSTPVSSKVRDPTQQRLGLISSVERRVFYNASWVWKGINAQRSRTAARQRARASTLSRSLNLLMNAEHTS